MQFERLKLDFARRELQFRWLELNLQRLEFDFQGHELDFGWLEFEFEPPEMHLESFCGGRIGLKAGRTRLSVRFVFLLGAILDKFCTPP